MRTLFLLITILLFLTGCSIVKGKEEAEVLAEDYFKVRIEKEEFPYELLDTAFLKTAEDTLEWKRVINLVKTANGKTKSYELHTWNVNKQANYGTRKQLPNGTNVMLVYKVTYDNGTGYERLKINRPLNGDEFKIIGINYQSQMIEEFTNKSIDSSLESESEIQEEAVAE